MSDKDCLYCQSDKVHATSFPRPTRFNNKVFSYRACDNCRLTFIHPLPDASDYNEMYSANYHDEFYFGKMQFDFAEIRQLVAKYISGKKMLDYGCGDGSFLQAFAKDGYECTGIEYQEELVEKLREQYPGINFYSLSDFKDKVADASLSAVHLGDVIEHMEDPLAALKSLHQRLGANGIIVAEGPLENNFHFALWVRKRLSVLTKRQATHVPYHISFSNAKNQLMLFEKAGFKMVYYNVYEKPWPYPSSPAGGIGNLAKYVIAKTSIALSSIVPPLRWGNRFTYIGLKTNN